METDYTIESPFASLLFRDKSNTTYYCDLLRATQRSHTLHMAANVWLIKSERQMSYDSNLSPEDAKRVVRYLMERRSILVSTVEEWFHLYDTLSHLFTEAEFKDVVYLDIKRLTVEQINQAFAWLRIRSIKSGRMYELAKSSLQILHSLQGLDLAVVPVELLSENQLINIHGWLITLTPEAQQDFKALLAQPGSERLVAAYRAGELVSAYTDHTVHYSKSGVTASYKRVQKTYVPCRYGGERYVQRDEVWFEFEAPHESQDVMEWFSTFKPKLHRRLLLALELLLMAKRFNTTTGSMQSANWSLRVLQNPGITEKQFEKSVTYSTNMGWRLCTHARKVADVYTTAESWIQGDSGWLGKWCDDDHILIEACAMTLEFPGLEVEIIVEDQDDDVTRTYTVKNGNY